MTRQLARRLRGERLIGIALAALGVVVLVVAVFALRSPHGNVTPAGRPTGTAKSSSTAPQSSPARTPSSAASTPSASPSSTPAAAKLPLVVLNDTFVVGLAQRARARFEAGGWNVSTIGNLTSQIVSTCAYYDTVDPNAQAAARALQAQFPAIKRVAPKFAELPPGPIVVVLTPDYS